jgi:acetyl esterase/lipase
MNRPGRPVVRAYGPDRAQFGELWLPGITPAATVVIIHGGFWRARYGVSLGRPLAADLAHRGYAVWNLEYRRVGAGGGWPATFEDIAAGIDLLCELPVGTARVAAIGHSAGGHLAAWAAGRPGLPPGAPGARPLVTVTAVISQAGVLALADCAREGVGGTAALDLMGGRPQDLPQRYRLADPMTAVPVEAAVLCLHSRADDAVPFACSERYVAAATRAAGRARLHETDGDHFTLIDPHSADWQVAVGALPGLLGLPAGHLRPGRGETGEDLPASPRPSGISRTPGTAAAENLRPPHRAGPSTSQDPSEPTAYTTQHSASS